MNDVMGNSVISPTTFCHPVQTNHFIVILKHPAADEALRQCQREDCSCQFEGRVLHFERQRQGRRGGPRRRQFGAALVDRDLALVNDDDQGKAI